MKKRSILSGLASFMLVGCTISPPAPDTLTLMLKQQATVINRQLPVSEQGVILVRASVEVHQMKLKFYPSQAGQDVGEIMLHYVQHLCRQPDVQLHIKQGARYLLEGTDTYGKIRQHKLEYCRGA